LLLSRSAIGLFVTRGYDIDMNTRGMTAGAREPAQDALAVFNKTIALVGLMGSGKSAIGRRLAKQLGLTFADSDQLVTKMAGVSVTEIFDYAGEAKFRDMEFRVIQNQLNKPLHVLATGGGAFCEPETAALLLKNAIVVWFQASPDTLLKRIGDTTSRPLLQTGSPLKILQQLEAARAPFYRKAHIHLNTDGLPIRKSLAMLVSALDSYRAKQ
jgi:shikimate kinase